MKILIVTNIDTIYDPRIKEIENSHYVTVKKDYSSGSNAIGQQGGNVLLSGYTSDYTDGPPTYDVALIDLSLQSIPWIDQYLFNNKSKKYEPWGGLILALAALRRGIKYIGLIATNEDELLLDALKIMSKTSSKADIPYMIGNTKFMYTKNDTVDKNYWKKPLDSLICNK